MEGYFALCLKTNPYTFLGPRPFDVTSEVGFGKELALLVLRDLRLPARSFARGLIETPYGWRVRAAHREGVAESRKRG